MTLMEAMEGRHSVRSYTDKPIDKETRASLQGVIDECNKAGGLHIQLVTDESRAFDSTMAHYGKFSGVKNYVALIGKKSPDFEEKCGYYGERIALEAQRLGLNTCWVALTYKKIPDAFKIADGEKLAMVIATGYGATQGVAHKSKPVSEISNCSAVSPDWFKQGIQAALLAPTAMNQQKFKLELDGDKVRAKAGFGFYTKIDLGIVKYNFEIGAGKGSEVWAK